MTISCKAGTVYKAGYVKPYDIRGVIARMTIHEIFHYKALTDPSLNYGYNNLMPSEPIIDLFGVVFSCKNIHTYKYESATNIQFYFL